MVNKECSIFVALLKSCATTKDLRRGIRLHKDILRRGLLDRSTHLANTLISTYAKCGALSLAEEVLEQIRVRNVVSWNALIAGYTQKNGHSHKALNRFEQMQAEGLSPDAVTYTCVLKACGITQAIEKGKQVHDEIVRQGLLEKDTLLGNAMVDMYAKCGMVGKAEQVLRELSHGDVVSWTAIIDGYAQQGKHHDVFRCFELMQIEEGISPNAVTFVAVVKACSSTGAMTKGIKVHEQIINMNLIHKEVALGNAVVDMYAKFGMLAKAREVLEELPIRDVVSWSALIAGYTRSEQFYKALFCLERMQSEGIYPNNVTLISILKACGRAGDSSKGERIHEQIKHMGWLENDLSLGTALVDMYAKCGELLKAARVFEELPCRDAVTWSALIAGHAQHDQGHEALHCFERMQNEGLSPDEVTFVSVLKACGSVGAIRKGQIVHSEIENAGFLRKNVLVGSALVVMYTKCGRLARAREVLEELPLRNAVSWSALIVGYARDGQGYEALRCFEQMKREGLSPDKVTFLSAICACNYSGLLDEARVLFGNMIDNSSTMANSEHHACMVMALGFAGLLDEAISMIKVMPPSDCPEIWFALLAACRKWGNLKLGRSAFNQAAQLTDSSRSAAPDALVAHIFTISGTHEEVEKFRDHAIQRSYRC